MREIVEFFINDLGARMDAIRRACDENDLRQLKTLAHQLKGAAGGYGFPTIGHAAADVEHQLLGTQADLASVQDRVEELLRRCRAAMPGT
jgi:HPt (histidine-containing phosphotransfer) domain-containing protein